MWKLIKKNYYVGDSLEIGDLEINAVTQNGNNKAFVGWEACKTGGFTSDPDNGYVFTSADIGEKTITIGNYIAKFLSWQAHEKIFFKKHYFSLRYTCTLSHPPAAPSVDA